MQSSITHAIDGKYIREWLVLGPFFPDDLEKDFLADVGGEANIEPKKGDAVGFDMLRYSTQATADGKTLTWKRYESEKDVVDLLDAVGVHEYATAYAFCVLQMREAIPRIGSEVAGDTEIRLGSDDGVAVWINGERVHLFPGERSLSRDQDVFEVNLKAGANRCLVKVFQRTQDWGFAMRVLVLPPSRAVISGTIADEKGNPITDADVRLEQDGEEIAQIERSEIPSIGTTTDDSGSYQLDIYPVRGQYNLSATSGDLGDWQLGIQLDERERRTLNLTLKEAISIEGTLLMLDDKTPHVAVVVQAVTPSSDDKSEPTVVATMLSDENGKYQFINLKPGRYFLRYHSLNEYVYYSSNTSAPGEVGELHPTTLTVERGKTLENIDFRFAPFKKGTWKTYTTLDGLAENWVCAIHGDPDGTMWFGTNGGGVSRYDGKEFVTFNQKDGLVDDRITTIYRDSDGLLWFGTNGGVSRFDGKEFKNFTTKDGLADNLVSAIYRDPEGVMWFGTGWWSRFGAGVSRYDGKEFVTFTTKDGLTGNCVSAIYRDPDGVMWFGTDGGVSRYDGKEFVNLTPEDGLLACRNVNAIHRDPDGTFWFVMYGAGVSRYDGEEFVNFTPKDGLSTNPDGWVWAIHRDKDGVMWFASLLGGGVTRYNGKTFVNFRPQDGLAHDYVTSIYRDPDGVLWFGTQAGVCRYDERMFVTLTTKDGLSSNNVRAIYQDPDGAIWFGTEGGVSRYDGKEYVNFTTKDGLAGNSIRAIHQDPDGTLWFGTQSGVSRYDGKGFTNLTSKDGVGSVHTICRTSDSALWFGAYRSIYRYDGKEVLTFTPKSGWYLTSSYGSPDGVVWFGLLGGISCYDGKEFVNFTTEDGLVGDNVRSVYCTPDGVIWFGTSGGVSRYNGKEFVNLTPEDGLAHGTVSAICRADDGSMWFGTSGSGVCGYDGISWTSLDTRDGLASNEVNAIHADADGLVWIGTSSGITRYKRSDVPPKVCIVSVKTDTEYTNLEAIPSITTGHRITIAYNAIDFKTVPEKRQYRCRIKEIDSDWRKPTKATSFDCIFDKPGAYTFEVQAIDRDLNYSEPASVKFEVIPDPRNHQIAQLESDLEKRNRELEQANAELERLNRFKSELLSVVSHELRTPLTSIDGFTRLIHERFLTDDLIARCNEATRPTIQRVKDRVGIIQENTSRLARLINDLLDFSRIERGRELEMHFARIELSDVIENVIATYQAPATEKQLTLKYDGEIPLHSGELEVFGDADRLAQVLSNLVSNAVKFTPESGAITLGTRKDRGMIELSVQDTGVGIPKEQMASIFEPFEQAGETDAKKDGTGLGLSIVKYIVDKHDGAVRVESEEGVGSTFIITLSEYVAEAPVRTTPQRILIVDDDYDILRLLEEGLSAYPNTRIITAGNSQDALKILQQQPCDVMITDVRMPGDISGIELATQVRAKYPELKVFVMTNTPEEKERVIQLQSDWIDKAMPNLIHYIAKKIGKD